MFPTHEKQSLKLIGNGLHTMHPPVCMCVCHRWKHPIIWARSLVFLKNTLYMYTPQPRPCLFSPLTGKHFSSTHISWKRNAGKVRGSRAFAYMHTYTHTTGYSIGNVRASIRWTNAYMFVLRRWNFDLCRFLRIGKFSTCPLYGEPEFCANELVSSLSRVQLYANCCRLLHKCALRIRVELLKGNCNTGDNPINGETEEENWVCTWTKF